MEYDSFHGATIPEVPQTKSGKLKIASLVAGADRFCCFYTSFGDRLAVGKLMAYEDHDAPMLFFPMVKGKSPGTILSSFLKALKKSGPGSLLRFSDVALDDLADDICAGAIRPGVANILAAYVPVAFALANTGHDLRRESAFYEYLDANRTMLMAGAVVLAGFKPFTYGQLGKGPTPASLAPLIGTGSNGEAPLINPDALNQMIDECLRLGDNATSVRLHVGGKLRPIVEKAFASIVMHYKDREAARPQEASMVCAKLRTAWAVVWRAGGSSDLTTVGKNANDALLLWSDLIRAKFDADNTRLTAGLENSHIDRLIDAVVDMRKDALVRDQNNLRLMSEVGEARREISGLRSMVSALAAGSPVTASSPFRPASATPGPSSPAQLLCDETVAAAAETTAAAIAAAAVTTAETAAAASAGAVAESKAAAYGSLVRCGVGATVRKITEYDSAIDLYHAAMDAGGIMPFFDTPQNRTSAGKVLAWFNAAATDEEKAAMLPAGGKKRDCGDSLNIIRVLQTRVSARLKAYFVSSSIKPPKNVEPGFKNKPSTLEEIEKKLREHKLRLAPSKEDFASFRQSHEDAAAPAGPSAAGPSKKPRQS